MNKENKKVPAFCLLNQNEEKVCLKDILSTLKDDEYLLLFFYPRDLTSGCTKEAVSLSENKRRLSANKVKVLGISKLDPASKRKFIEKYNLKLDLLSDTDLKVAEKYGVLKEKNMYGRKTIGISRESFLIDKSGKIIKHFKKVKPETHAQGVLDFVKSLKG